MQKLASIWQFMTLLNYYSKSNTAVSAICEHRTLHPFHTPELGVLRSLNTIYIYNVQVLFKARKLSSDYYVPVGVNKLKRKI